MKKVWRVIKLPLIFVVICFVTNSLLYDILYMMNEHKYTEQMNVDNRIARKVDQKLETLVRIGEDW